MVRGDGEGGGAIRSTCPPPRVVVVTACSLDYIAGRLCIPANRAWAERHGYAFHDIVLPKVTRPMHVAMWLTVNDGMLNACTMHCTAEIALAVQKMSRMYGPMHVSCMNAQHATSQLHTLVHSRSHVWSLAYATSQLHSLVHSRSQVWSLAYAH